MKNLFFLTLFLMVSWMALPVWAFEFSKPLEGEIVVAGTSLKVLINIGGIDPLLGAQLLASRGIVQPKIDSLPPYKWEIEIPPDYYGPLTLWAIGRRYFPVANPPKASVTIFVVQPLILISFGTPALCLSHPPKKPTHPESIGHALHAFPMLRGLTQSK